ncbi:unnamed protein product [Calypogeia fissa]
MLIHTNHAVEEFLEVLSRSHEAELQREKRTHTKQLKDTEEQLQGALKTAQDQTAAEKDKTARLETSLDACENEKSELDQDYGKPQETAMWVMWIMWVSVTWWKPQETAA